MFVSAPVFFCPAFCARLMRPMPVLELQMHIDIRMLFHWKSRYAEYGAGCLEWMEARQADQWSQESRKPACWSGDNPGIGPVCCEGFVQYEKAAPYGAAGLFTRANLFSVFIVIPQLLEHPKRTDLNAGLINHRLNFRGEAVPIGLHFGIFILHIYHHR